LGRVVTALGLAALLGFGGWSTYNSAVLAKRGKTAEATCTKITTSRRSNRRRNVTHHVSYATADGEVRTGTVQPWFEGLLVGEKVEVLYDPLASHRVEINRFWPLWGMPLMFGGITAAIGASWIARAVRRSLRPEVSESEPSSAGGGTPVESASFGPIERDASSLRGGLEASRSTPPKHASGATLALVGGGVLAAALAASWLYDQLSPVAEHEPRQASPLTVLLGFGLAGLSIPIVAVLAVAGLNRRRRSAVTQAAEEMGWRLTSSQLPAGTPEFPLFANHPGGHFEYVLLSNDANDPLLAVYEWTEKGGKHDVTRRELCAIYPFAAPGLPDMVIRPEMLEDKIMALVRGSDIDFTDSPALIEFSKKYLVRAEDESRVREIVDERLAQTLLDHPGWTIETKGGSVLTRWQRMQSFKRARHSLRDAAAIKKFLEESRVVAQAVREAAA